jgi:hypothetical protein
VFPNPYHPNAPITLRIKGGDADVVVCDVQGPRIKTLHAGPLTETVLSLAWDGRADGGSKVAAGLYFLRVRTGSHRETRSLLLLKEIGATARCLSRECATKTDERRSNDQLTEVMLRGRWG